jgi:hypothetical protein
VPHLVESGAMLYMYLAVPPMAVAAKGASDAMGGMPATGSRFSFLALVLALFRRPGRSWFPGHSRFACQAAALQAVRRLAASSMGGR